MIKKIPYFICLLFFTSFLSATELEDTPNKRKMRFFCLDFHCATAADIKSIFEELGHEVVVWIMPGAGNAHAIMGRGEDAVEIFNVGSWISHAHPEMYQQFYDRYKDFLSQFDGFIAAYNSSFVPLYEKFDKPTIVVNAIRYEIPFSAKPTLWAWLNEVLMNGVKREKLFIVANNKGDQAYLKHYTGLDSEVIPSLCLYTHASYTGLKNSFICQPPNQSHKCAALTHYVQHHYPQLISGNLARPFSWQDLYDFKGIIHFPYQNSTMSIFEEYSANVPLFFPSKQFLTELRQHHEDVLKETSYFFVWGRDASTISAEDLNHTANPKVFQFWMDHADFYDEENMPYIQYFDSFDHLKQLLETVNTYEISQKMEQHNKTRKEMVLRKWQSVLENVAKAYKIEER